MDKNNKKVHGKLNNIRNYDNGRGFLWQIVPTVPILKFGKALDIVTNGENESPVRIPASVGQVV